MVHKNFNVLINKLKHPLGLIFLLGFLLRAFSWYNTSTVNSDAIVYIAQAKALFFNHHEHVLSGRLSYLSIYSLLIACFFPLFGNWIACATSISFFFGTFFFIPLYLFVKEALDRRLALIITLIYAALPVFVSRSVDIIKDPIYWFFMTFGLYFHLRQIRTLEHKNAIVALLLLALAAMVRVEASIFFIVSLLSLLITKGRHLSKLVIVVLTLIFVLFLLTDNVTFFSVSFDKIFRAKDILSNITTLYAKYGIVRAEVKHLADGPVSDITGNFLLHANRAAYLIALETFINGFLEGVAYLPGVFIFIGIVQCWAERRQPKRLYCLVLLGSSLLFLYLWTILSWILSYRYIILFTIPAAVCMGLGLNHFSDRAAKKWRTAPAVPMTIAVCLILAITMTKDIKPRREELAIYRQLGQKIASVRGNDRPIIFAANSMDDRKKFIFFYANLNYKGYHPVIEHDSCLIADLSQYPYRTFMDMLKAKQVDYYLMTVSRKSPKAQVMLHKNRTVASWQEPDGAHTYLIELL